MKGRIVHLLRADGGVVSGETLSARLGVSRVSVWKHISKLKDLGYPIASTPRGYRLIGEPDMLFPWEFPGREDKIHYAETVTSTMDIARDLARRGCSGFTVVVAGRQTKGRGRLQRTWLSDPGGLYLTIVLRPEIPPLWSGRVNLAVALVLARTLRRLYQVDARAKWPNDVLLDGRKLAGMLAEMEAEADRVTFINIGIGINVNNDPSDREPLATSLRKICGRQIARQHLLSEFLNQLEDYFGQLDWEEVIPTWKQEALTLNRMVRIVTTRAAFEGLALDVDDNGALIVQLADGNRVKVIHGDCFH